MFFVVNKIVNILNDCSDLFSDNLLVFGQAKCFNSEDATEVSGYYRLQVQWTPGKKVSIRYIGNKIGDIHLKRGCLFLDSTSDDFIRTSSKARALDELVYPLTNVQKDLLAIELVNFKNWAYLDRFNCEDELSADYSPEFYDFLDSYSRIIESLRRDKSEDTRQFRLGEIFSKIDSSLEGNPDESRCIFLLSRLKQIKQTEYKRLVKKFKPALGP